jgi:hypothetical protein
LGLVFAGIKHRTLFSRFIFGYLLAILPYSIILSVRIHQHNYYQMPFLPLVCILAAYFIYNIGVFIKQIVSQFTKNRQVLNIVPLISLLLVLPTVSSVEISINRQFDMQFIGYDEAGKYVRSHSSPDERIFLEGRSAGQGASLFGHADRFGAWLPDDTAEIKRGEEELNFRWIVLYNEAWRQGIDQGIFMVTQKPGVWAYIQENYQIKQVGFVGTSQNPIRVYMVLEKTGPLNESMVGDEPSLAQTYVLTSGSIQLYTVEAP